MAKLPRDVATLLEQLRHVDNPTPEERQRADAGVRDMLTAQGLRQPPPLRPMARAEASSRAATTTLKLWWGSAAVLVMALGSWGASTRPASVKHQPPLAAAAAPQLPAPIAAVLDVPPPMAASSLPPQPAPARAAQRPVPHQKAHSPDALAEELRFLASVDADIRGGAYDRALRRLLQNKAASPLQEERSAMRVLALCGLDHDRGAARARDQFLKGAPSSLLAARVRSACKDVLP